MDLPNRIMATPHATPIGNLWSPDEAEADRNIAYWAARARAGLAWVGGISAALENHLVPGFEPTGVGAAARGVFRLPYFHDRIRKLTDTLRAGACHRAAHHAGGMPHGPRPRSPHTSPIRSHALDRDEIAWFINEYAESARRGKAAGRRRRTPRQPRRPAGMVLSPAQPRDDEYGGDLAGRMRFLLRSSTSALKSAPTSPRRLHEPSTRPRRRIRRSRRRRHHKALEATGKSTTCPSSPAITRAQHPTHHYRPPADLLPRTEPSPCPSSTPDGSPHTAENHRPGQADSSAWPALSSPAEIITKQYRPRPNLPASAATNASTAASSTAPSCAINPYASRNSTAPYLRPLLARPVGGGPAAELAGLSLNADTRSPCGHGRTAWRPDAHRRPRRRERRLPRLRDLKAGRPAAPASPSNLADRHRRQRPILRRRRGRRRHRSRPRRLPIPGRTPRRRRPPPSPPGRHRSANASCSPPQKTTCSR